MFAVTSAEIPFLLFFPWLTFISFPRTWQGITSSRKSSLLVYTKCLFSAFLQYTLCKHAKSFQWCLTLCKPMDCSPPSFSVHGILQVRIPSRSPCPPPGDLPNPGIKPTYLTSLALAGGFFTTNAT